MAKVILRSTVSETSEYVIFIVLCYVIFIVLCYVIFIVLWYSDTLIDIKPLNTHHSRSEFHLKIQNINSGT